MNRSKLESYMGFAAKSRNMVTGYNTCMLMMKKRQIKLLVIASDLSDNTKKKMLALAEAGKVRYRIYGDVESLCRLYKEIVSKDWFMTLLDVKEYIQKKEAMLADYEDELTWSCKTLVNIAKAGFFSSDRTIAEYNRDIWHL